MRSDTSKLASLGAALLALAHAAPASACGLALAIGLDVSRSVDVLEYQLQLDGTAKALQAPAVKSLLLERARAQLPATILVFEWSSADTQAVVASWTVIDGEDAIDLLSNRLSRHARRAAPGSTAIGAAISYAEAQFELLENCDERTLDLSGDGKSNHGASPEIARAQAARAGITINGLVVGHDRSFATSSASVQIGELVSYFQTSVIAGDNAFVETALGFANFEEAMIRKLTRELRIPVFGKQHDEAVRTAQASDRINTRN